MSHTHKRILRSLICLFIVLTIISCTHYFLCYTTTNTTTDDIWQTRITKVLNDIRENSIKNREWGKREWEIYTQDVLLHTNIANEEDFYESVTYALKKLGDNHSFLIKKPQQQKTSDLEQTQASIRIEDSIGIITLPRLMTNTFDQEAILNEKWVADFQSNLEQVYTSVSKGWVIDLTLNTGGNMYPMLAALSTFLESQNLGGFVSYSSPDKQEQYLVSFDGQKFIIGKEQFAYTQQFPIHKNSLPVIVLIGSNTASSGEFVALTLKRQTNVTVVGQPTYGIATGNGVMPLPDNLGFYMLTSAYLLDSNNKPLLKMRVDPDLLIPKDRDALLLEAKKLLIDKEYHHEL